MIYYHPGWNCLVTNLNFHDFRKFSQKRPRYKTSLTRFNFIKLPIKCVLNLAAVLRPKVLQVSSRRRFLKAAETVINFTALSMQINFCHNISFKVASYSACYLTNGDYIRFFLEKLTRENKVIAAGKKWKCFQF